MQLLAAVLVACLAWTAVLFGIASWGERSRRDLTRIWPYVFALSLGVHCTAWTYYGAAAQGLQSGFITAPTLLGMSLVSLFCVPFLRKLAEIVRETNSATIADMVVARLGADLKLGAAITLLALLGIVPYIALQLRAMTQGLGALLGSPLASTASYGVSAFFAAVMALFTILFGARHASATDHNRGIVLALAFESLVKLAGMLAVGAYALFLLGDDPLAFSQAVSIAANIRIPEYLAMAALGTMAAFTLPHQFHVGVVELRDPAHLNTARWLFPAYLILIGLPGLPLALAGMKQLGGQVSPDLYIIALPHFGGQQSLAVLAYIGGLSAATGMMILSALTLSIMIGNHWFGTRVVRGATSRTAGSIHDLRPRVLAYRRIGIIIVFTMAWLYSVAMSGVQALANFGLVSFTALAQLAPAILFAAYRHSVKPGAVLFGLATGTVAWSLLVLLPLTTSATGLNLGNLWSLPAEWPIAAGTTVSLAVNLLAVLATSGMTRARARAAAAGMEAEALRQMASRFLSPPQMTALLGEAGNGPWLDEVQIQRLERGLTSVVGAGMARLLVESARRGTSPPLEQMRSAVGDAAQAMRFNQQLLEAALENMSQGISVVDAELRLVAWNRRYQIMFGFPEHMLQVGRPLADLTRWALLRMPAAQPLEEALARRIHFTRQGLTHHSERTFPDGCRVEIRGNPMPGGGYVATFTDVTAFRSAEAALRSSNENLEHRVEDRTAMLKAAVEDAERANLAKTRFLTAIGHDLIQPVHAARLLTDSMSRYLPSTFLQDFLQQIRNALDSTDNLLAGLLDISRLEAGGLLAEPHPFPLTSVLEPLAREFSILAAAKGLRLHVVPTRAWVNTDPQLLRRILQNFLANAVRYSTQGGVLIGARRVQGAIRVDVVDTGPGIASEHIHAIFEEFHRGRTSSEPGLGLGLTIADRMSSLLNAPLGLRSEPGRGSMFSVTIPRCQPVQPMSISARNPLDDNIAGKCVMVVDNDADVLGAVRSTLQSWGCVVAAFHDHHAASFDVAAAKAQAWILDYHLDHDETGVSLWRQLVRLHGQRPTIIITGDATPALQQSVRNAGLDLLNKPFKPLALRWAINHLLSAGSDGRQRSASTASTESAAQDKP